MKLLNLSDQTITGAVVLDIRPEERERWQFELNELHRIKNDAEFISQATPYLEGMRFYLNQTYVDERTQGGTPCVIVLIPKDKRALDLVSLGARVGLHIAFTTASYASDSEAPAETSSEPNYNGLEAGNIVTHVTGGPSMVVSEFSDSDGKGRVCTQWWGGDYKFLRGDFHAKELVKVQKSTKEPDSPRDPGEPKASYASG